MGVGTTQFHPAVLGYRQRNQIAGIVGHIVAVVLLGEQVQGISRTDKTTGQSNLDRAACVTGISEAFYSAIVDDSII